MLKHKIKFFHQKKRAIEVGLDGDNVLQPVSETMNDFSTCVGIRTFDFGTDADSSSNEGGVGVGDKDFLNEVWMNGKNKFDSTIKLQMRCVPDW